VIVIAAMLWEPLAVAAFLQHEAIVSLKSPRSGARARSSCKKATKEAPAMAASIADAFLSSVKVVSDQIESPKVGAHLEFLKTGGACRHFGCVALGKRLGLIEEVECQTDSSLCLGSMRKHCRTTKNLNNITDLLQKLPGTFDQPTGLLDLIEESRTWDERCPCFCAFLDAP